LIIFIINYDIITKKEGGGIQVAKLSILNERMEKYACENVSQIYEDFNIKSRDYLIQMLKT